MHTHTHNYIHIIINIIFQAWEYIRTSRVAVFYFTNDSRDERAPPHSMIITEPILLNYLSGPALLYGKDIIVCTRNYYEIPNNDYLTIVRLR
nr:hypothetical protein [Apis mellifera nudivirus]